MWQTIVAMTWLMAVLAVVLSVCGYLFCEPILKMLKVPGDVLPYSVSYLKIIFAFTGGMVIYNWASSILRSVGDSKTPLYALIAASFINIELDLFEREGESYFRSSEHFSERAYEIDELKRMLTKSGFEDVKVFHDMTSDPLRDDSDRAVFVARIKHAINRE
jgi:hypothetical protein